MKINARNGCVAAVVLTVLLLSLSTAPVYAMDMENTVFYDEETGSMFLVHELTDEQIDFTLSEYYSASSLDKASYARGSGTADDPYVITTAAQLNDIRNDPAANYKLENDIDLSVYEKWTPIKGSSADFSGTFDGNGKTISGLVIDSTSSRSGLFHSLSGNAVLKNIILADVSVTGTSYVGALAGEINGTDASILNCHVSGSVAGDEYVGGLVGHAEFTDCNVLIDSCSFAGRVYANGNSAGGIIGHSYGARSSGLVCIRNTSSIGCVSAVGSGVGGLMGSYFGNVSFVNTYVAGDVSGGSYVGGLVGHASANGGSLVSDSYVSGKVLAKWNSAGGLFGRAYFVDIENSAALNPSVNSAYDVGRLIGTDNSRVTVLNTYAIDSMSLPSFGKSDGSTVSASEAVTDRFYSETLNWDFDSLWKLDAGIFTYPVMQRETNPIIAASLPEDVPVVISKWTKGDGSAENPYLIESAENLAYLSAVTDAGEYRGKAFRLTNSIDLSRYDNWKPIGISVGNTLFSFSGFIDGNSSTISNLVISGSCNQVGLFGIVSDESVIQDLYLSDVTITGDNYVGGLTGGVLYHTKDIVIARCSVSGVISGSNAGGVVGGFFSSSSSVSNIIISDCFTDVQINGYQCGGIGGDLYSSDGGVTVIQNCYALGSATGSSAGGILGGSWSSNPVYVVNSSLLSDSGTRRIAGEDPSGVIALQNNYVLGSGSGASPDAFYVSAETAQTRAFYEDTLGWDFDDVWQMGVPYPVFQVRSGSAPVLPTPIPTVTPATPVPMPVAEFSGSGTATDPYRIGTAAELAQLSELVNCGDSAYNAAHYVVTADINLSGYSSWTPIGIKRLPFQGSFNGSGYAVTGLTIYAPDNNYTGMFGYIKDAEIRNVNITVENVTGGYTSGGLVGRADAYDSLTIENCYAAGSVNATDCEGRAGSLVGYLWAYDSGFINIKNCYAAGSGTGRFAGGFVGFVDAKGSVTIENCSATGSGTATGDNGYSGGLVGYAYTSSSGSVTIENCYATGNVIGNTAGGLVGYAYLSSGGSITIGNCYATGEVTGVSSSSGLVGRTFAGASVSVAIRSCAALSTSVSGSGNLGRIVGGTYGTVTLTDTYALNTMSAGGKTDGLNVTPADAASQSFYEETLGWDFVNVWMMDKAISQYPFLQWQNDTITLPWSSGDEPTDTEIIVQLKSGWNFISIPNTLNTSYNTATAVFSSINTDNNSILTFNAKNQTWNRTLNNDILQPMTGYWIYSVDAKDITLEFNSDSSDIQNKEVYEGWNTIGIRGTEPISAHNFLLNSDWKKIIRWDTSNQEHIIICENGGTGTTSDEKLEPTVGYWVYEKSNGTISN